MAPSKWTSPSPEAKPPILTKKVRHSRIVGLLFVKCSADCASRTESKIHFMCCYPRQPHLHPARYENVIMLFTFCVGIAMSSTIDSVVSSATTFHAVQVNGTADHVLQSEL